MKWIRWLLKNWRLAPGSLLCIGLTLAGCENSSSSGHLGDGHDFGPNNPNLYVAFGDSITAGAGLPSGDAYSYKLAGMLNKTVVNKGFPGYSSGQVLDVFYPILDDYQPGYMLILIGVNDIIMGYGEEVAAVNIRIMIQACSVIAMPTILCTSRKPTRPMASSND